MSRITVLEEGAISLWYHPEHKIVHHQLRGFLPAGVLKKVLTAGAELMEQHGARKWLSDDQQSSVVREEDSDWGEAVWSHRVIRAGFKYWAIVQPTSPIALLNMRRFAEEYRRRGVTVSFLATPDAAIRWLESL